MKIGILGSGFGIYGYLPAVIENGHTPVLLQSKVPNLKSRPELNSYFSEHLNAPSIQDLIETCDAIVLAIPPRAQYELLNRYILNSNIKHLFLEKPLGINSAQGGEILRSLDQYKKSFSLAYLFLWTDWFQELFQLAADVLNRENLIIEIEWTVPNVANSWKSNEEIGGGLSHFFSTHLFALYYKLGFNSHELSVERKNDGLRISGFNASLPTVLASINYGENSHFVIRSHENETSLIFEDENPFGARNFLGKLDNRIPVLAKYIASSLGDNRTDFTQLESFVNEIRCKVEAL